MSEQINIKDSFWDGLLKLGSIRRSLHKREKAKLPWLWLRAFNVLYALKKKNWGLLELSWVWPVPALGVSSEQESIRYRTLCQHCLCLLQVRNVGVETHFSYKLLGIFQDADGTSCRFWNNRNIFHMNYYLISCTRAGPEQRPRGTLLASVSFTRCFSVSSPTQSEQLNEAKRRDMTVWLNSSSDSSVATRMDPVCCNFNCSFFFKGSNTAMMESRGCGEHGWGQIHLDSTQPKQTWMHLVEK